MVTSITRTGTRVSGAGRDGRLTRLNPTRSRRQVSHGRQITDLNTGYEAMYDPTLGRNLVSSDLTVVSGTHDISDFVSSGTAGTHSALTKKWFTGDINLNVDYLDLNGCRFDAPPVVRDSSGHHDINLNWCTVDPSVVYDWAIGVEGFSAYRCKLKGNSDGVRTKGGASTQVLTECWIRTKSAGATDHNDGAQNDGGDGIVIFRRCNIDPYPIGGPIPGGGVDGTVLFSEFGSASVFRGELEDCYFDCSGGDYALRLYDGGSSVNVTYKVTGCRFAPGSYTPVHRGLVNITPTGQIEWSGNVWDNDGSTIPLT